MVKIENYMGEISISEDYLVSLISHTASQCFGIADLNSAETRKGLLSLFRKAEIKGRRGVKVSLKDNSVTVIIHISVLFGTNFSAVTESAAHKIRYTVEDKTGLKVSKISFFIDGVLE